MVRYFCGSVYLDEVLLQGYLVQKLNLVNSLHY